MHQLLDQSNEDFVWEYEDQVEHFQCLPGMHLIKIHVSYMDNIEETIEDPSPESLSEAPSWRNLSKPTPLTSSIPPSMTTPQGTYLIKRLLKWTSLGWTIF
jgi:hypothetical protein